MLCIADTTTKGAKTLGSKDNRTKGLFHLMYLLRNMRKAPRWIFLENVKGFYTSDMLAAWKSTLESCGYYWREYLVSPVRAVGVPNHRMRYYMIAQHKNSAFAERLLRQDTAYGTAGAHNSLPRQLASQFPVTPVTIGSIIGPVRQTLLEGNQGVMEELYVPLKVLSQPWASGRLSIATDADRQTYCFTKGYGKLYDRSTGSLFLEADSAVAGGLPAMDPIKADANTSQGNDAAIVDDPELAEDGAVEDGSDAGLNNGRDLVAMHHRLRSFHPQELLALFGFPAEFTFPASMVLHRKFACIGNSINVTVVRQLMRCLFEPDIDLNV
jgi:tRNA (cytosine38-C5)-methyltransferase